MVKKKIFISLALGASIVGSVAILGNTAGKFDRLVASPNTLEFSATTNNYEAIGAAGLKALTSLNNPIDVNFSNSEDVSAYSDGAFTLAANGYIENSMPVTGITSVTVDTANGEDVKCGLGYFNAESCLWVEDVVLGDTKTFNFNNTHPDFLRITNNNAEAVSFVSIKIQYECASQANIWELKGSFNSWGDGVKMYYHYSYENIATEDEWMLTNFSFAKNDQFKFHNPSQSAWVGAGNATISDADGSAKKAGQISGTDNIMVKTAITTDLYLKVTRDATPKYSIWVKEDTNAEPVEEINAYEFQVVGSTSATGNWSIGNGHKFTLDETKSTATTLYYTTTIKLNSGDLFKICCIESGQWIGDNWGRHQTNSNIGKSGENFKVNTTGTYLIELNGVSPKFGDNGWDLSIVFTLQ